MWVASRRWYTPTATLTPKNVTFYGVLLFRCLCVSRYGFPSSFFLLRGIVLKFCHLALLVFLNQPVYFRTAQQPWSIDIFIKSAIGQKWYCVPPGDDILRQKTPEMNELEADIFSLKISAHNFEKQQSYNFLKIIKKTSE